MDFAPTPAQTGAAEKARALARTRVAPGAADREAAGRVEPELLSAMGSYGLIAPELPPHLGGHGADRVTAGLVTEEIAAGDVSAAYVQVVGSLVGQILAEHAPPELARTWVRRLCSGQDLVGIGLTEPHAGSDAANLHLTARREGGTYVLDGVKSLSFCGQASAAVLIARTGPDRRRGRDISAFLVPLDLPGVDREPYSDMGTKAVGRGAVHLDGVRVPADHRLGPEGEGFSHVLQGFDFSRALIGLQCLGAARSSLEETWEYVGERTAFDRPLSTFQGVAFPLAEAETRLSAARLLCLRTLWLKDTGRPHTCEAAMCKWWAPVIAHEIAQQCLLLHGQYGYRTERPLERRMRDVLGLQIGDGTAQIMKLVIARQRLGRELAP